MLPIKKPQNLPKYLHKAKGTFSLSPLIVSGLNNKNWVCFSESNIL